MAVENQTYLHSDTDTPALWRGLRRLAAMTRPALGWPAFLLILLLGFMPAVTQRDTAWVEVGRFQTAVDWAGPLAVVAVWILFGWRREEGRPDIGRWRAIGLVVALLLSGQIIVLQFLVGWFPGPIALWEMAWAGNWSGPFEHISRELGRVVSRVMLWQQGMQTGGSAQDNLVVALGLATLFWIVAAAGAWIARHTQKGLIIALPPLWLVLMQLAYTSASRGVFVYAILLAILLHLVLDQRKLVAQWHAKGLDFNPGIGVERFLSAGIVIALIVALAAIFPNVYITPIAQAYYDRVAPLNEQLDGTLERAAPDAQIVSRMRRSGMAGGLPNDFLLLGGPDLRQIEVLRYRTNEPWFMDFPFDEIGPPGYYMRGGTFANYNGRGWGNPSGMERMPFEAEQRRELESSWGRKELIQSVILSGPTQILYAAPEIVEATVDFRLETRGENDVVAAWARERSYTIVSETPAVSEAELRNLPPLDDALLADEAFARLLELPDTVTDRTRQLSMELTQDYDTAYEKAAAIEAFLRTYEYDLTVPAPPGNVTDIADYFLFELQRGYCDYYATAFVVLARMAGLPARFATGFSMGYWDPMDASHVVTEADAHSWAEVYFPEVGWIPFEPTAAQPLFSRIGTSTFTPTQGGAVVPAQPVNVAIPTRETGQGNWQLWLWAIPGALLVWGLYSLWQRMPGKQRDPWHELLAWGRRLGRPIDLHETPLEYGQNLGDYLTERMSRNQDTGRVVAREMQGLGADISDWRYGHPERKAEAGSRASSRWARLRDYRRVVRL